MPATTSSPRQNVAESLMLGDRWRWPVCLDPESDYARDDLDGLVIDANEFAWAWFKQPEHDDVDQLVAQMRLEYFDWDAHLEKDVQKSHRNAQPKPIIAWVKAHLLREIKGWRNETALQTYFQEEPFLPAQLGFNTMPKQSDLHKWREHRFSDELNDTIRRMASEIVAVARERDVPCPAKVFRPEKENKKKDTLTIEKTEQVWSKARPYVDEHFETMRADNAYIPDEAYWEQHAYMGMREEMYASSGATSFLGATDRAPDKVPTGSSHRHQLRELPTEKSREMHRNATEELVKEARRNGELDGGHVAAIDITKGFPYTGKHLDDYSGEKGDPVLGYKDNQTGHITYHYQWASIQIVGHDVPLILDAIPIRKGESPRDELVDELLGNALDIVDSIDTVLMDKEFWTETIRNVCLDHGVHPFTPVPSDAKGLDATKEDLRENEVRVRVEEQQTLGDGPTLKRIFVPLIKQDDEDDEGEDEDGDDTGQTELWDEMAEDFPGELDEETASGGQKPGESPLHSTASDIVGAADYDGHWRGEEFPEDIEYAVFQTTHPDVSVTDEDGNKLDSMEVIHMAARWVRQYRHRWGIENGYKKLKTFMVRTTSMDEQYRHFCFMFACLLYNVWRLVDMLVKLSVKGEYARYEPYVTANTFLTVAQNHAGPVPPPD